jgi:hypothetical protein
MRFRFETGSSPTPGQPSYAVEDHALTYDLQRDEDVQLGASPRHTSLSIGTIQIEVSLDTYQCLYVWGYCPSTHWKKSSLSTPIAKRGRVFVETDAPLFAGVSVGIEQMSKAKVRFDIKSGWLCIGTPECNENDEVIEFATSSLAVLNEGRLRSIWIRPQNWCELEACV